MTDYQTARVSLGARLREVRTEAGLSGRVLAQKLGWHPSKVSKLELGRQTASVDDLEVWAKICGNPKVARELVAQRRALETHYTSWRRRLAAGTNARQSASIGLERRTRRLHVFQTSIIPGLLQTPDYARYVLRYIISLHGSPDDLEAGVRARMERQRVLEEPDRVFDMVIWEPALRMRICPRSVMLEQLDRIAKVMAQSRVDLGIIPLHKQLPALPEHSFWIFDDHRVHVETIGAELCLTDDDAIAPYRTVFAELSKAAVRGPAALRIVARIRHELAGEPGS